MPLQSSSATQSRKPPKGNFKRCKFLENVKNGEIGFLIHGFMKNNLKISEIHSNSFLLENFLNSGTKLKLLASMAIHLIVGSSYTAKKMKTFLFSFNGKKKKKIAAL